MLAEVRWFDANVTKFELLDCPDLEELGDFATIELDNDRSGFSRFFNKVEIGAERVTKTVIDKNFNQVHVNEVAWYRQAQSLGFRRIPKVYNEPLLILERIMGHHAYQDGTMLEHDGHKSESDKLLPNVKAFWSQIASQDIIVLLSARTSSETAETLDFFFEECRVAF